MFDLIIANGRVVDGSGNPWFSADIAVKDGRIVRIGRLQAEEAREVIDAAGRVVAPGFVDIHCHSDALLFAERREEGKVLQGVTTEVIGNCGISAAPTAAKNLDLLKKYTAPIFARIEMPWDWEGVGQYLERIEARRTIGNVAALVGHGAVRIAVMGFDNRDPDGPELAAMRQLVATAMEEGAFGLSSGLIYPPGLFSKTPEMIALCREVAARNGLYSTHMRNESDHVLASVDETIEVGFQSGVSVNISHHKVAGRVNWGKSRQTLARIEEARRQGLDVTCDVYPYIAGSTMLGAILPPWVQEGGVEKLLGRLKVPEHRRRIKGELASGLPGWENLLASAGWDKVVIAACKNDKDLEGKSIAEIAAQRQVEPAEAVFDIMLEEDAEVLMVLFLMAEDDVAYILSHPVSMVGSDAIPSPGKPHPRFFGTFPRVLGKYVREDKVLTLPEAVRKMTSFPAQKLGLYDRGLLREGMWADITVFDPERIADRATFADPVQRAVGMECVVVNGTVAVRAGVYTGALTGKVLRKGG